MVVDHSGTRSTEAACSRPPDKGMSVFRACFFFFSFLFRTLLLSSFWTSRSHRCRPFFSPPGPCLQLLSRIGFSTPTARRFFIECLLTHALALSASQFVHKKKSLRVYTSMHSAGFELTKLTYTRLEDNLIRHVGCNNSSMRSAPGKKNGVSLHLYRT